MPRVQPVLHVRFVVEVGHLPAVLLVVVVVRVGRVVGGGDGLGVGGGGAVVEVDLAGDWRVNDCDARQMIEQRVWFKLLIRYLAKIFQGTAVISLSS